MRLMRLWSRELSLESVVTLFARRVLERVLCDWLHFLLTERTKDIVRHEFTNFSAVGIEDWFACTSIVLELCELLPGAIFVEVTFMTTEVTRVIWAFAFGVTGFASFGLGGLHRC